MSQRWEHHRIPLRDGFLAVRVIGNGPQVLLLHGIPGAGSAWDRVAELLMERHQVFVPDLLGFGASSRPRAAEALWADAQRDALTHALDRLGVGRAVVVGHDFGGPIALKIVEARPDVVSHLVLASTNAFPDTPIPFPLSTVTWSRVGPLAERIIFSRPALAATLRAGIGRPGVRLAPDRYLGDRDQQHAIRTIFAASLRGLAERYGPIARSLGSITVPTVILWGDRDPFFAAEQGRRTARAIPGARLVLLEGAGHFLPEERPRAFAQAIEAFGGGWKVN